MWTIKQTAVLLIYCTGTAGMNQQITSFSNHTSSELLQMITVYCTTVTGIITEMSHIKSVCPILKLHFTKTLKTFSCCTEEA